MMHSGVIRESTVLYTFRLSMFYMVLTLAIATHQPCGPFLHMLEKRLELGKKLVNYSGVLGAMFLGLKTKKETARLFGISLALDFYPIKLHVGRKSHNHFFVWATEPPGETRNSPFRQNPRELFGWPAIFPWRCCHPCRSCWMRKRKMRKLRVSALPAKVLNVGMLPAWDLCGWFPLKSEISKKLWRTKSLLRIWGPTVLDWCKKKLF